MVALPPQECPNDHHALCHHDCCHKMPQSLTCSKPMLIDQPLFLPCRLMLTTLYFSNFDSGRSNPMFRRSNPHVLHMFLVSNPHVQLAPIGDCVYIKSHHIMNKSCHIIPYRSLFYYMSSSRNPNHITNTS